MQFSQKHNFGVTTVLQISDAMYYLWGMSVYKTRAMCDLQTRAKHENYVCIVHEYHA